MAEVPGSRPGSHSKNECGLVQPAARPALDRKVGVRVFRPQLRPDSPTGRRRTAQNGDSARSNRAPGTQGELAESGLWRRIANPQWGLRPPPGVRISHSPLRGGTYGSWRRWAARSPWEREGAGSNPADPTGFCLRSSVERARRSGRRGRWFESSRGREGVIHGGFSQRRRRAGARLPLIRVDGPVRHRGLRLRWSRA